MNNIGKLSYIDNLRFPLMLGVILIHSYKLLPPEWESGSLLQQALFGSALRVAQCVVPLFFFISGFLFFFRIKEFNLNCYKEKIHRRIYTLLVPYILWILLDLFYLSCKALPEILNHTCSISEVSQMYTWKIFWFYYKTWPLYIPFWFIRDLMVVCVFSPLIYLGIKYFSFTFPLLLGVAYLYGFESFAEAFFYFSSGAFFSIKKYDLEKLLEKYKWIFIIAVILLFPFSIKENLCCRFLFFFEIFCLLLLSSKITRRYHFQTPRLLLDSAFFILATHTMFDINRNVVKFLKFVIPDDSALLVLYFRYLVAPFIVGSICVGIFGFLQHYCPRISKVLMGKRVHY